MKKNILLILIGIIIGGSIIGVVAYTYNAKDIVYIPSNNDWKVNNIKDAIDDLYTEKTTYEFEQLYYTVKAAPENFSYTFTNNTKNILINISSISCTGCNEASWSISLPDNAVSLYDVTSPECFKGTCGNVRAASYYIPNASGTISGSISYRGAVKIMQIK